MFEEIMLLISSGIFIFMTVGFFSLKEENNDLKFQIELERENNKNILEFLDREKKKNTERERYRKREIGGIE